MIENENPKPFNISRQKCQRHKLGRTALLGLSVNQSIYRQISRTEFKSKTIKNLIGSLIFYL